MPLPPAPQPISETDYEAIEAAVKETARGRWFLDEYAERNRNADTRLVLEAIQRLQRSVLGAGMLPVPAQPAPALSEGLSEIEQTAQKTRTVLSQMEIARRREGNLGAELDDIISAQAQAVTGILSDTGRIGEISAVMRSEGMSTSLCDRLDGLSAHIGSVCAFQDATGQRAHKVMLALRVLEARVAALVKLWQADTPPQGAVVIEHASESTPVSRTGDDMREPADELLDPEPDIIWDEEPAAARTAEVWSVPDVEPAQTKTAPLPTAPSPIPAKRSELDRLTFDERLALFT